MIKKIQIHSTIFFVQVCRKKSITTEALSLHCDTIGANCTLLFVSKYHSDVFTQALHDRDENKTKWNKVT